ncbi:MAG: AraC family transcriptional regulator [Clostridia bacterium]|nr:AraC family transcriptional regulator [Clostridia bacterium]
MIFSFERWEREKSIFVIKSIDWHGKMVHSHDFIELVYITAGKGIHSIENKNYSISTGDLFIVFPGENHSLYPIDSGSGKSEFTWITCGFLPSCISFDFSVFPRKHRFIGTDSFDLNLTFHTMLDEYDNRADDFEQVLKSYLTVILIRMKRHIGQRSDSESYTTLKRRSYCKSAVEYISEHSSEHVRLEDVAHALGISCGYLSKIFKEEKDQTFMQYLYAYRVKEACRLLVGSKMPISRIANAVGFSDRKSFYTQFTRIMCLTPGEYRSRH